MNPAIGHFLVILLQITFTVQFVVFERPALWIIPDCFEKVEVLELAINLLADWEGKRVVQTNWYDFEKKFDYHNS